MSLPTVTVCIPSYNHAKYLEAAIESVIAQTYTKIEFIIIDDGSTDESLAIIRKKQKLFTSRFVRHEVRSRANKGLPTTLNEALTWSKGKYFVMLSSDDILLPNKVGTLVDYLDANEFCAGVFGGMLLVDSNGLFLRKIVPQKGIWGFRDVLEKRCTLWAPTMMMRTKTLLEVGGYWEDIALEDRAMTLKLTQKGYKLATIDTVVAKYRTHANNTIKNHKKMLHQRLKIYRRLGNSNLIKKAQSKALYGYSIEIHKMSNESAIKFYFIANNRHSMACLTKAGRRALKKIILHMFLSQIKGYYNV